MRLASATAISLCICLRRSLEVIHGLSEIYGLEERQIHLEPVEMDVLFGLREKGLMAVRNLEREMLLAVDWKRHRALPDAECSSP